jgi:NitT/TauT family transport system permease protein
MKNSPKGKGKGTSSARIRIYQILLLLVLLLVWHLLVQFKLLSSFFFGEPLIVLSRMWAWFASGVIYEHLFVTLLETLIAFFGGLGLGLAAGLWLGLSNTASLLLDPYIKALNAMPRVILGPIFVVWFGLGIWSKVVLGITLVFCVVFFNVFQGVREVNSTILSSARMLGSSKGQLLRTVYLPSATSWVFSSLHTSIGMAFVGAVIGEYLGSAKGVGYLILQAEAVFDVNTVFAGIVVLTLFALALDAGVTVIEKRLMVWRPTAAQ